MHISGSSPSFAALRFGMDNNRKNNKNINKNNNYCSDHDSGSDQDSDMSNFSDFDKEELSPEDRTYFSKQLDKGLTNLNKKTNRIGKLINNISKVTGDLRKKTTKSAINRRKKVYNAKTAKLSKMSDVLKYDFNNASLEDLQKLVLTVTNSMSTPTCKPPDDKKGKKDDQPPPSLGGGPGTGVVV
jgi:hypothetical protein